MRSRLGCDRPAGPSWSTRGSCWPRARAALLGLSSTYTGSGSRSSGCSASPWGSCSCTRPARWRWPAVAPVLLAVLAFFLLGGPLCLRAAGAVAPTPRTLGLLTDQLVLGWKDLLTTLPPVDGDGPLLVLPWALGLAAGTLGAVLAGVSRRAGAGCARCSRSLVAAAPPGRRHPARRAVAGLGVDPGRRRGGAGADLARAARAPRVRPR